MKTPVKILALIFLTTSLSSCEKIKSLFDVEIDSTLEAELDFVTNEAELKSTNDHGFNKSTTLQIMNEDLVDYEDLIKNIQAKSVTIEVLSVDSAGMPIKGVVILEDTQFLISNPMTKYAMVLDSDWPIEPGFSVELPEASYPVLNDILNDYKTYAVSASAVGTCNKGNIHIVLNYNIEVNVESNPL